MVVQPNSDANNTNYLVARNQIKVVDHFTYLGSIISLDVCIDHKVTVCVVKASAIFGRLSHVWKKSMIKWATKMKILRGSVYLIMLYGADTWPTTATVQHHLNNLQSKWLSTIEGIWWTDFVSNDHLQSMTYQSPLKHLVAERTLRWFGHVFQLPADTPPWILYNFEPTISYW